MRMWRLLEDFLGHREAYPVQALFFFTYAGTGIVASFILVTFRHEGFSGKEIALVATTGQLIGFFAQPLWGVVADRFGRRRCLGMATLMTAAIYCRMYWVRGFCIAAVEQVNQLVSPEWRATGQALRTSFNGAGVILGTLSNGFLLDYFRSHFINSWVRLPIQKVFLVSALLLAAVTVVAALVFRPEPRQAPTLAARLPEQMKQAA